MSGKLEIILCCNAPLKRLPITMRQSALTAKLLNCQSGYQKRWAAVVMGAGGSCSPRWAEEEKKECGGGGES